MKNKLVFKITFCAIIAAMSGALALVGEIHFGFFEATLSPIPLIVVSVVFGPVYGLLSGLVAGFIEQLAYVLNLQTILWLLSHMAWGGFSGLLYYLLKRIFNDNKIYKKIIIYSVAIIISALIANVCNSMALAITGYASQDITDLKMFIAYAVTRFVSIPVHAAIFIPVCYLVCDRLKKISFLNSEHNK